MLLLFLFNLCVYAQYNTCPLPADPSCLMKNAQFTILGTILDNNFENPSYMNRGTATNYNATVAVQCVWGSFTNPPANGYGLVNSQILVTGFGNPRAGCPPTSSGSSANINSTQIMFVYYSYSTWGSTAIYSLSSPCAGLVPYNSTNVQTVANVLASSTRNQITGANSKFNFII
jgi:hypothetical protein